MHKICHHIALLTNGPTRLIRFYAKGLGFKREKESLVPKEIMSRIFGFNKDCRLIRLYANGIRLEIISPGGGSFKPHLVDRVGYSHWAYGVNDKIRFCKMLEKKGVGIIKAERDKSPIFFIKDPDGNLVEIQQSP